MLNNVVLDVFIGIVLVYLLYSLFITIIGEMIATWMNLRSRILRVSIEKMLNDGLHNKNISGQPVVKRLWDVVQRFFLKEFAEFKNSFAGKFYAAPAIKYLSDNGGEHRTTFTQTKPSYISADMFASALIQILKDKGVGNTDSEKINFCLQFNTHLIQPASLKSLRDHFENAGGDISILKERFKSWYIETQDRATGWYKKKLQLILFWLGLIVAVMFNVDSIGIVKILSKDKDARNQLTNMAVALSKDSAKYAPFINSKGDTIHAQAILDSGYAHISKDISDANMVLGLGWPLADMVKDDARSFDKKHDSSSFVIVSDYKSVINEFGRAFNKINDSIRLDKKRIADFNQLLINYKRDTAILRLKELFLVLSSSSKKDSSNKKDQFKRNTNDSSLQKAIGIIDSISLKLEMANTEFKADSATLMMLIEAKNEAIKQVNAFTSSKFKVINYITNDTCWLYVNSDKDTVSSIDGLVNRYSFDSVAKSISITIHAVKPFSTTDKVWNVIKNYNPFRKAFWSFIFSLQFLGLIITALMLSLGAPFWFDLLKKLVAIRGAGIKPEEKKEENKAPVAKEVNAPANANHAAAAPLTTSVKEDPVDIAFRIYADQIRLENGVVNVIKAYYQNNGKTEKCIQVKVINEQVGVAVKSRYGNLRVGQKDNEFIYLDIVVTGTPQLTASFDTFGNSEKGIANNNTRDNVGSYGCLVKKVEDPKKIFLLSCYHVMNADLEWENKKVNQPIINKNGLISTSYEGFLTNLMDAAITEITEEGVISFYENKLNFKKPLGKKDITIDDVFKTQVLIEGFTTTAARGLVVNDSSPETFKYPLKNNSHMPFDLDDLIVISHQENGFPDFIGTSPGDSGAIVLDEDQNAIGIVVGCDLIHTYVIKISNIFRFLGLELITA